MKDWPAEILPERSEPGPSPTSLPALNETQLHAKLLYREQQMERQPCYRCDHSPNSPDPGCPCCHDAHTPDQDGHYTGATAGEFADYMHTMRP